MTGSPPTAPVLIVDDDPSVRDLVQQLLAADGVPTLTADGGEAAWALIQQQPVSLVVLDDRMPGVSGRELITVIRNDPLTATLPIVMLTGNDSVADRVGGLAAGADDYVVKPFEPAELVARIRSHLRGRQAWLTVVEAESARRLALARALSRISPRAPAEWSASLLCRELALLPDITHVAVFACLANGDVVGIAQVGEPHDGVPLDRPLPAATARGLVRRAGLGPWVVERDEPGMLPSRVGPGAGAVTVTPLRAHGRLAGLLAVRAARGGDDPASCANRALSVATEFASYATEVLGETFTELALEQHATDYVGGLLETREFQSAFQPVIDLTTMSPVGYEALARFPDGRGPLEVFADARRLGRGMELELAAVDVALEAAAALPADRWLGINLSPAVVVSASDLAARLAAADRDIVIEVTEQERIDDYPRLRSAVAALGPRVRLAIDDAGAGYSSFGHVLALEPAFIKIDRSWVKGIADDLTRRSLVVGIVHFAAETGTTLVAEGIERTDELDVLLGIGVELGQGYLLGPPRSLVSGQVA